MFWERHGTIIYKSISGVRSVVSRMQARDRTRLADLAWCPTQFQAWIPGGDYRVHVVGDSVFAVEVISDADDYRYAGSQGRSVTLRPCALPVDVAEAACGLSAELKLPLAGIDLRRTPDGEWYCFEVNPSPCFTYYETPHRPAGLGRRRRPACLLPVEPPGTLREQGVPLQRDPLVPRHHRVDLGDLVQ